MPQPSLKPSPTPSVSRTPSATLSPKPTRTPKPPPTPKPAPSLKPDAELDNVADEFIRGYLAARPLHATALGFHEYDGRISEYTRLAIDAELARLRRFDDRLNKFDLAKLSPRAAIDLRLLQAAIKKELFLTHDMAIYEHNPMTYASAIDVNVYVKRKYAPIEDRVRSIIVVENQAPNIMIAAKTNLAEVLPKPYVELAIQIARGSSDFLKKNLLDALADLKDENLRAALLQSNRRAATALADYAAWLEKEKLPKASPQFAIGEENYARFLAQTELVDWPPAKILEFGLSELKHEQGVFAEAAKKIDADKPAPEVFKQIQSEHPTPENLIPEITKKLDSVRKYVVDHKLVTIPSEVRAQVKETPQYRRATSFASMDTPGPFEKRATEAYFYVTPAENEWPEQQKNEWLTSFNSYSADIISIHETYPGHYVQFLHLNASKATRPEKIFGTTSYIEGWAHYCEKMVIDAGFGSTFGPSPTDEEIRRGCEIPDGASSASDASSVPPLRFDQDAHAGNVGGRRHEVLPGELLLRREARAGRGDARNVRHRLPELHVRQAPDSQAAQRLRSAGGRKFFTEKIPRRTAQPRDAPDSPAARDHAQRPGEVGRRAVGERLSSRAAQTARDPTIGR